MVLLNRDFIDRARFKKVYCPHQNENIPMLTCVNPPGRNELVRLLEEAIDDGIEVGKPFVVERERSLRALVAELHSRKSFADIEWLLVVLAAVAGPQCEVFLRGYEPPKTARGAPVRSVYIDNSDGFFSQAQPVSAQFDGFNSRAVIH